MRLSTPSPVPGRHGLCPPTLPLSFLRKRLTPPTALCVAPSALPARVWLVRGPRCLTLAHSLGEGTLGGRFGWDGGVVGGEKEARVEKGVEGRGEVCSPLTAHHRRCVGRCRRHRCCRCFRRRRCRRRRGPTSPLWRGAARVHFPCSFSHSRPAPPPPSPPLPFPPFPPPPPLLRSPPTSLFLLPSLNHLGAYHALIPTPPRSLVRVVLNVPSLPPSSSQPLSCGPVHSRGGGGGPHLQRWRQ